MFRVMYKRGQVTIFLLVGIIILAIFGAIFYFVSTAQKKGLEVQEGELPLTEQLRSQVVFHVESCVRETIEPATYLLAVKGGVIYPDEDSPILLMDNGYVNYAWINGQEGLSRSKMEQDLGTYLKEYLHLCIDPELFSPQGITVTPDYENLKADVSIKDTSINVDLNFPLTVITADGNELDIDAFSTRIQSNLGAMSKIVESLPFPEITPADLEELPYQPVVFPFNEQVVIYSLAEQKSEVPLTMLFAVRNDHPDNQPPKLDFIPDQTFRVGSSWDTLLTAQDPNHDRLTFSSNSPAVPVSEEGEIKTIFTQTGTYKVLFKVKDAGGLSDAQKVSITVLPARENVQPREVLPEVSVSDQELEALYVGQ